MLKLCNTNISKKNPLKSTCKIESEQKNSTSIINVRHSTVKSIVFNQNNTNVVHGNENRIMLNWFESKSHAKDIIGILKFKRILLPGTGWFALKLICHECTVDSTKQNKIENETKSKLTGMRTSQNCFCFCLCLPES